MRMGLHAVVALLALLAAPPAHAESPAVLRVSAIPDENPNELMRIYRPFADYLSEALGLPVEFRPVVDYAATVESLAAGKLDLVWYGGFTSVQAVRRTGGQATRLVMRQEDAEFRSVFVARPGSGISGLGDLRGKTFSFGSVSSTSGHLMPRFFLRRHGIDPDADFREVAFSGAHDATALWVQSGKVDAGALNFLVWDKLVTEGKVDRSKVDVFWTTPPYVDYVWTARSALDPELRRRIAEAFLALDYEDPEDRKLLDLHRTKKYVPAKDEDWKPIEDAAIEAGLLQRE